MSTKTGKTSEKTDNMSTKTERSVRAPRGTTLSCKGWTQEAALRMLMNNLDPEVAERPQDLVVYGIGAPTTPSCARCATSRTTRRS